MSQKVNNAVFYVEFPATDLPATKLFYQQAFGWTFEDYGPSYVAFEDGQLAGGFYQAEGPTASGGALVVLWADDLAAAQGAVEQAGGAITKPIFAYPGSRRFHFTDPNGNELSVCGEA